MKKLRHGAQFRSTGAEEHFLRYESCVSMLPSVNEPMDTNCLPGPEEGLSTLHVEQGLNESRVAVC